jgi:hypothetical protein
VTDHILFKKACIIIIIIMEGSVVEQQQQQQQRGGWRSVRSFGIIALSLAFLQALMITSVRTIVKSSTQANRILFANASNHYRFALGEPNYPANNTSEYPKGWGIDYPANGTEEKVEGGVSDEPKEDGSSSSMQMVPIMAAPIHSICRLDRSGSAITDMLYAHAYALAHNLTYAGACCLKQGFPRKETIHLLQQLQLDHLLPYGCPDGVAPHLNLSRDDAIALSPLILNPDVYRDDIERSYFTEAWRDLIRKAMAEHPGTSVLRADRPFEIAVHVRRGDVSPCKYKRRYLPNNHFLQLIDEYTPAASERSDRPVHVTIYSESKSFEPFDAFRARNYTVELDTKDLALVWKALVTADVVPAAVNTNTVVATRFFGFQPLEGWKEPDDELVKASDKLTDHMSKKQCAKTTVQA